MISRVISLAVGEEALGVRHCCLVLGPGFGSGAGWGRRGHLVVGDEEEGGFFLGQVPALW